eukprot:SM000215S06722  [mRNA]  locus=s215:222941:226061:+ [translate_table: standard]
MASAAMHRLLLLCCFLSAASLTTGQDLKEIDAYLAERSAAVVTTLKGEGENDIYDCVNVTQQYSLRHPSMKNHKFQMKPSKLPNITLGPSPFPPSKKETCPKGTIPVLRHGAKAVLAAGSVAAFMARYPTGSRSALFDTLPEGAEKPAALKNTTDSTGGPVHIMHRSAASSSGPVAEAAVGVYGPTHIYGATAYFNLYAPYVQSPSEYSTSQMWLYSGSPSRGDLTVIEAGWQVFPKLYGDKQPHLFIAWTRDSYRKTGCYNLDCKGFVQTSSKVRLGAILGPISKAGSATQYSITLTIFRDPKTGNWWLAFGKTLVGYWPRTLLPNLKFYANFVRFGGEVLDTHPSGLHTQTDMGNGNFAASGVAAYISNIGYINRYTQTVSVGTSLDGLVSNPLCYDIGGDYDDSEGGPGAYILFGGQGYNKACLH